MSVSGLFNRRVRGFRVVEVVGLGILLTLVTSVYMAKTMAGRERNEITRIEGADRGREGPQAPARGRGRLPGAAAPHRAMAVAMGLAPIQAEP
jgi:hypothetical protein